MSKQGQYQGPYEFHRFVNGRYSWKTSDESNAIWFNTVWFIGPFESIGGYFSYGSSLVSWPKDSDTTSLFDVPSAKWYYSKDGQWELTPSDDIVISCVTGTNSMNTMISCGL